MVMKDPGFSFSVDFEMLTSGGAHIEGDPNPCLCWMWTSSLISFQLCTDSRSTTFDPFPFDAVAGFGLAFTYSWCSVCLCSFSLLSGVLAISPTQCSPQQGQINLLYGPLEQNIAVVSQRRISLTRMGKPITVASHMNSDITEIRRHKAAKIIHIAGNMPSDRNAITSYADLFSASFLFPKTFFEKCGKSVEQG